MPEIPKKTETTPELPAQLKEQKQKVEELARQAKKAMEEHGKDSEEYREANEKLVEALVHFRELEKEIRGEKKPEASFENLENPEKTYEFAERLFGENFLGIKQVERAFTVEDKEGLYKKLVYMTDAEQERARDLLHEKLKESDMQVFLEKIKSGELDPGNYMLILRLAEFRHCDHLGVKTVPVTMIAMEKALALDMDRKDQGKLFRGTTVNSETDAVSNEAWYRDYTFYTRQQPGNKESWPGSETDGAGEMHWQLVSQLAVSGSLGQADRARQHALLEAGMQLGLDINQVVPRTPVEITWDYVVALRNNPKQTRFLFHARDSSKVVLPSEHIVNVGAGGQRGLKVGNAPGGMPITNLGVHLSR